MTYSLSVVTLRSATVWGGRILKLVLVARGIKKHIFPKI